MTDSDSAVLPVYLSFPTFQSAVNNLRAHGLPPRLDRSAWSSRSGAEQGQIISAFKFLGLIDNDGNTQRILRAFVDMKENSEDERNFIAELLKTRYARLFESVDLKSATPKQVNDAIGAYGTTGATKDRAVRFFLKAAEHSKIPLSSRLTSGMRSRGGMSNGNGNTQEDGIGNTARPRKRRQRSSGSQGEEAPEEQAPPNNAVKTISLRDSGGSLTLSGTFNAFELDGEDRKLVYDIIDLMKRYERGPLAESAVTK